MRKFTIIFLFYFSFCFSQATTVKQYLCYSVNTFSVTNTVSNESVNLFTFVIPVNKTAMVKIRVAASYMVGVNYFSSIFEKVVYFQNSNGVATIIGGANLINPVLGTGMGSITEVESVSGASLNINVKGQTGTPLYWTIYNNITLN